MSENLEYFKNIIQKNGYEFTLQKRIILKTILESKTHLKVKEIYEKIKHKNIGIATIYRNLKVFNELGIVKKLNVNGVSYYEMKIFSKKPLHVHFKCSKCNKIMDIDSLKLNLAYLKLNECVEKENDLEIYDLNIMFVGLCSQCKKKIKD
ncbi:peroxide-responsive repressor PerR [Clostridium acetireducens DSM 10703]|uniref:Peroxide-responsive repressor PerR n=1 Tax=Clostridium acetireducens DSM 10703 TaxID=1121290 RepID=A0A1E8EWQ9_9CLOT|nr:Fur family transcriptional regulator [Clostridium acetireducens]OFI05065.1 peroxide-responsive repressor PerR [Clostridium acetireducens DSM 10703]